MRCKGGKGLSLLGGCKRHCYVQPRESQIKVRQLTCHPCSHPHFHPLSLVSSFSFPSFWPACLSGPVRSASASKSLVKKEHWPLVKTQRSVVFLDLQCRGKLVVLTALEALVDGCHHVGGLLPGVQQGCLKGQSKSNLSATFRFYSHC